MPNNAFYSGGVSPGASLFAVDGDFTVAAPCGPPEIDTPFTGDSFPNNRDIVLLNLASSSFVTQPVGTGYNIQPFNANQTAILLEQEFIVAEAYYLPLPLNTPYWVGWSIGWSNDYANLGDCFLVKESPLENIGGGLVKFKRTFATLPPTRNEYESYSMTFPAFTNGTLTRLSFSKIVSSRIQSDFFLVDMADINIFIPLYNSDNGRRLNGATGINPTNLLIPEMRYFQPNIIPATSIYGNFLIEPDQPLSDGDFVTDPADPTYPTNPSYTQYLQWKNGVSTSNALAPEIVAEASSFNVWMGNIYVRKTRFVVAQ